MNRRVALVALGVVVLMTAVWYAALWRPSSEKLRATNAATAAAQARSIQLKGDLAGLVRLEKTLPRSEAELRQVRGEVPATLSVDTVIDQINAIALQDHIKWTTESQSVGADASAAGTSAGTASSTATTTPTATATASSTTSDSVVQLSLDVSGTYADMSTFLTSLQHRPRLIVIDQLAYAPISGDSVSVTITARTFYNPSPLPVIPKGLLRS